MKKIVVLGIVLSSLVVFGCGKAPITQDTMIKDTPSGTTKSECMLWCEMMRKSNEWNKDRTSQDMNKDCNVLCDASQGIESNDVTSCEKSEWILKDTCFSEIAQDTNDISVCKKISEKTFLYSCYTALAEKQKNASVCENIDDTMRKSICIQSIQSK